MTRVALLAHIWRFLFFFSSFEHFERIFASFSTSKLQNCNLTKIRQNLRILGQNSKKFVKLKGNREFFVMKAFWRIYAKINVKSQLLLSYELIFDEIFFLVLNILNEFSRVFRLYFYIYFWARGSAELPSIWRIFSAQILIFLKMSRKTSVYNSYLSQNPRLHFLSQFWVKKNWKREGVPSQ